MRTLHMSLRIAGSAEAEGVALSLLDVTNQLDRVAVVLRARAVLRQIAAKRQNILNALLLVQGKHFGHMFPRGGDTGQMCKRRNTVTVLNLRRNLRRKVSRAAARAVGHRHEIRVQCRNLLGILCGRLVLLRGLRRKYFERKCNGFLFQ